MLKTLQDLWRKPKGDALEISPQEVRDKMLRGEDFVLLDVREPDEFRSGHVPGAQLLSQGLLPARAREVLPSLDRPVVTYCAAGVRSLAAARTMKGLGYARVSSMAGGIKRWGDLGYPTVSEGSLSQEQWERYSRHILLPQVGEKGQQKLLEAKVLVVGAGGLGSPASIYLAAAGVGRLGILDSDRVDLSNLQRQILHFHRDIGVLKAKSARRTIQALNPNISVVPYSQRLDPSNVLKILQDWDLVLDGADNFPTKFLLNDACYFAGKPLIYGSIFQFEGQATVFAKSKGPCYRCLFPVPPPPGLVPT